jgi:hypothetical protein
MKNLKEFAEYLNSIKGCRFVGIKGYTNNNGEVSDILINLGASYVNAKEKDIEYLRTLDVTKMDTTIDAETLETARVELLNSLIKPSETRSEAQTDTYLNINQALKIHKESLAIFVYGYCENKRVITEGEYKEVKSRPLTIAKNFIKKNMRTGKFRQYKLDEITMLKVGGLTIE